MVVHSLQAIETTVNKGVANEQGHRLPSSLLTNHLVIPPKVRATRLGEGDITTATRRQTTETHHYRECVWTLLETLRIAWAHSWTKWITKVWSFLRIIPLKKDCRMFKKKIPIFQKTKCVFASWDVRRWQIKLTVALFLKHSHKVSPGHVCWWAWNRRSSLSRRANLNLISISKFICCPPCG